MPDGAELQTRLAHVCVCLQGAKRTRVFGLPMTTPSLTDTLPDPMDLTNKLEGMLGLATLPPKLMKYMYMYILNKEYIHVEMYDILPVMVT